LLSLGLYSKYKEEGESFVPKIEKILAAGGSRNPQEVLQNREAKRRLESAQN